jgi:uncharacterized membrane protein YqjE
MDVPAGGERDAGLKPALQRLVAGGLSLARARLELASVELALERARFTTILALAVAGAVLATLALAAATLLVVAYYWDSHRYEAIVALVVVYGGLAAFALLRAGAIARRHPTPFAASIAELEKDRRWLAGEPPPAP